MHDALFGNGERLKEGREGRGKVSLNAKVDNKDWGAADDPGTAAGGETTFHAFVMNPRENSLPVICLPRGRSSFFFAYAFAICPAGRL